MRNILILLLAMFSFRGWTDTRMDTTFMFGPSLSQSGNIQDLGDPNYITILDFNYYFQDKHGIGLSVGNEYEFDGSSEHRSLDNASIHTFEVHYTFRHRIENSKFKFSFSPGFGWQTIYSQSDDYYWGYDYYDDLSSAWIFNYKVMLDYIFFEEDNANFFAGVGLTQIFSYNDSFNGQDISGNRLSGLFRIGVGY